MLREYEQEALKEQIRKHLGGAEYSARCLEGNAVNEYARLHYQEAAFAMKQAMTQMKYAALAEEREPQRG